MKTKAVLLVEDNEGVRDLLNSMLSLLGYSATAVCSAEEALVQLETQTFPILLTDIALPGMSGLGLAERVHMSSPTTKIILTTGQGFLLSSGLPFEFKLIPKPFHLHHIEAALVDDETLATPILRSSEFASESAGNQ